MDYHKINDIKIDGSGNLVLQDVSGSTVTINYNDSAEFGKLLFWGFPYTQKARFWKMNGKFVQTI